METGPGEGAAGVPQAGSHSPVEFSDYQSLAALPPGGQRFCPENVTLVVLPSNKIS